MTKTFQWMEGHYSGCDFKRAVRFVWQSLVQHFWFFFDVSCDFEICLCFINEQNTIISSLQKKKRKQKEYSSIKIDHFTVTKSTFDSTFIFHLQYYIYSCYYFNFNWEMGYFDFVKSLTSSLLLLQKILEEAVFFHFERNVLPNLKYIYFFRISDLLLSYIKS